MNEQAQVRREALRCLYVDYGVPVSLLAKFSGLSERKLNNSVKTEMWQCDAAVKSRRMDLAQAFDRHLERMEREPDNHTEHEKAARTLIAMSKVVELLTALEEQMDGRKAIQSQTPEPIREPLNETNIEILNQELAALVARVDEDGALE